MVKRAIGRFVRVTPRKARTVVNAIRGRNVREALQILRFVQKDAAGHVRKVLESAVANSKAADATLDVDKLVVSRAVVQEGPKILKRWRMRAHGRATRIIKRMSHIEIVLGEEG
ncbi:MAG: 50S ribosomal protein L22 [Deltaproteobacteria bacterium]|nr:50S ribosomal protein L22 [Deltaproteobacteria bacterium]